MDPFSKGRPRELPRDPLAPLTWGAAQFTHSMQGPETSAKRHLPLPQAQGLFFCVACSIPGWEQARGKGLMTRSTHRSTSDQGWGPRNVVLQGL